MKPAVLHGRDCIEYGTIQHAEHGGWGLALCRGLESPAPKQDPNEDSCGVVTVSGASVAVVADAHFGRSSAETAVDALLYAAMSSPPDNDPIGWLKGRLSKINRRVLLGSSACALLAVVVQEDWLSWASIGDCRLYRLRSEQTVVLNPLEGRYLGDWRLLSVSTGEYSLQAGDRIILASDGLPECRYNIPTLSAHQVGQIATGGTAQQAAINLTTAALEHGGEDNIAVALLSHR
ncbi:MAG: serine/threonine protein phosphatase PrpC [Myxococcota bacterium]